MKCTMSVYIYISLNITNYRLIGSLVAGDEFLAFGLVAPGKPVLVPNAAPSRRDIFIKADAMSQCCQP